MSVIVNGTSSVLPLAFVNATGCFNLNDFLGTVRENSHAVNVSADESILDEKGEIDAGKLDPIVYDSVTHAYWNIGKRVGQAFSDGKKIK